MKALDVGSARGLGAVTIVGTKYHGGAHEYIKGVSIIREFEEQCLFLVADPDTEDVWLHNGKQRLGLVAAHHLPTVRTKLQELSKAEGSDQVLVVRKSYENSLQDFKWQTSFNVEVKAHCYERLARKYADKYRKEK